MGRCAVAVFLKRGQYLYNLLEPYNANKKVAPYVCLTRQEAIDHAKKYYDVEGKTDEQCWQMVAGNSKTDEDGNIYSTYNSQSKWDFWQVGGKFDGKLLVLGVPTNIGLVKDVQFSWDEKAYQYALRYWDVRVEHQEAKPGKIFPVFLTETHYRERYGNRETYARYMAQFVPDACITPDGKWHEISDGTHEAFHDWHDHFMERFVDNADDNLYVTIVDCHIL